MVMEVVAIKYGHHDVGALSFNRSKGYGVFEYEPSFVEKNIQLSPLKMPLSRKTYAFPQLNYETFKGLPGMVADSLPDNFGNTVFDASMVALGKSPDEISPLQRLRYIGKRGMGALEYTPATRIQGLNDTQQIEIDSLVDTTQKILSTCDDFETTFANDGPEERAGMMKLMSVGMNAGGARPKALLAFNKDFTQVRSGHTNAPKRFTQYLVKLDGIKEHDSAPGTFGDPQGYSSMEYVYYLMASRCGIEMKKCALLPEGNRRHFITERFDRENNEKVHVQTLNSIAHVDYKKPGQYSYAELFDVARQLRLDRSAAEQLLRRMCFNIIAHNQDDHSKNVAFLLKNRKWQLAPAYDVTFSCTPGSKWLNSHWMSLNGKRKDFTRNDFYSLERLGDTFNQKNIDRILDETIEHVSTWKSLAEEHEVPAALVARVSASLRLGI